MSIDLQRLPSGERGWNAFIAWGTALGDDRYERHYLELKGVVDLTQKAGRHKVAKFILGAANRDAVKAEKYFDGRALMVLGVGAATPPGVGAFEMQHLEADVAALAGVDGPVWDLHRIPLGDGRDILVIIVDPPTGRIWPTLKDGAGLFDGDVYVRVDGASRKAKGGERELMLRRAARPSRELDVDVQVLGQVLIAGIDRSDLRILAARRVAQLQESWELARATSESSILSPIGLRESRSDEQFQDQVARFEREAHEKPELGVLPIAAFIGDGIQLMLTNANNTFLRDIRVDLEFDYPLTAVRWAPKEGRPPGPFANSPAVWGQSNPSAEFAPLALPGAMNGRVRILRESPAHLSVTMAELRPGYEERSDDDDVVLVAPIENLDDAPEKITGKWKLSAARFDDLREGSFMLEASAYDWVEVIRHVGGL